MVCGLAAICKHSGWITYGKSLQRTTTRSCVVISSFMGASSCMQTHVLTYMFTVYTVHTHLCLLELHTHVHVVPHVQLYEMSVIVKWLNTHHPLDLWFKDHCLTTLTLSASKATVTVSVALHLTHQTHFPKAPKCRQCRRRVQCQPQTPCFNVYYTCPVLSHTVSTLKKIFGIKTDTVWVNLPTTSVCLDPAFMFIYHCVLDISRSSFSLKQL